MTDDWAARLGQTWLKYTSETAKQQQAATARRFVRSKVERLPEFFSKTGNREFFKAQLQVQKIEIVLAAARKGDRDALEILREHVRGNGHSLSDDLHAFILQCFIDGAPKASPGAKPKDTLLRDQMIAMLVRFVNVTYGFPIYRNAEHRGEETGPITACRIVGEEVGLSEDRIEKICAAYRKDSVPASTYFARLIMSNDGSV